jgi:hypothetical protein
MAADQEREQPQTPTANNGRGRRLKGAKSTTNTSSTSPRKIAITKRRAKMLGFREQGYTYDQIARHFKVGTSTVCRDIFAAMDAIIQEPAQRLLKLELRRLDAMQSAHYANALDAIPRPRLRCCGLCSTERRYCTRTIRRRMCI